MKSTKSLISSPLALLWNLILAYIIYMLCRLVFLFENWKMFADGLSQIKISDFLTGAFLFDTSAILYTNALYALMMLLPLKWKETTVWQTIAKYIFLIVNGLALIINLCDAVYFQFTGRRTTTTVFSEFNNEGNLTSIFGVEILRHWYLVIAGIALIYILWKFYRTPQLFMAKKSWKYYLAQTICLAIFIPVTICGMRGGATMAVRPITISNANQYVNRPSEVALVLNTPFSLIRTINKNVFADPGYFTKDELDKLYSPVHEPTNGEMKKKNVVVMILESFGREYIGFYNDGKGYTPFLDSLISHSLTYEYTFSNGRKSIDGMPSILASIPRFREPFVLTPAAFNNVSGLAGELGKVGYYSAFFHGAENGSMGFMSFARSIGYNDYFGLTEYVADKRFNGKDDHDGYWAIWDEEFLQFYALKMSEFKQPFVTSVFTATSHHPYQVPPRYKDIYKDAPGDDNELHKCIQYVDHALRHFFDTARKQTWFDNTIFVLTADHTNKSSRPEYQTDLGLFCAPIVIYDPSGDIKAEKRAGIAQHIDIMPTILNYLGYDKPYVAFGLDLFNTPETEQWAVGNNSGVSHYIKGDYVIFMTDDGIVKGIYNHKTDWMLQHNLHGKVGVIEPQMERELKAILQSYMQRMTKNELIIASSPGS